MNKTEMLERVNNAADARDAELARQEEAKRKRINEKVMAINALGPRIKDMLDVAKEPDAKRFSLGKKASDWIKPQEFVTEGIEHRMGFYVKQNAQGNGWPKHPYAFGIEGGGYSGYGLEIDEKGTIVRGMPSRYGSAEGKMDYVIIHFDEVERKFYDYVESL